MNMLGYPYGEEETLLTSFPIRQTFPYLNSYTSPMIVQTPESILAKIEPQKTIKLLEEMAVQRYRTDLNEIGCSVINTYLNRLNSEDASELKECGFEEVKRRNILGFVTERGMKFTFRR